MDIRLLKKVSLNFEWLTHPYVYHVVWRKLQITFFGYVQGQKVDEQRITLSRSLIKVRGFLPHSIEYLFATIDDDVIYALELFIDNIDINI